MRKSLIGLAAVAIAGFVAFLAIPPPRDPEPEVREAFHTIARAHLDLDMEKMWSLLAEQARADMARRLERYRDPETTLPWFVEDREKLSSMSPREFFLSAWDRAYGDPGGRSRMPDWLGKPEIRNVVVKDGRSIVEFRSGYSDIGTFEFIEENGRWRFLTSHGIVYEPEDPQPALDLPWADSAPENRWWEQKIVNVFPDGRIDFGDALKGIEGEETVLIRCDRAVPWRRMSGVYTRLAGIGIRRIQLATKRSDPPPPPPHSPIVFETRWSIPPERLLATFLPRTSAEWSPVDVVIEVRGSGVSELDRTALRPCMVRIARRYGEDGEARVLLCPDAAVPWGDVVEVLDEIYRRKWVHVLLATPPARDYGDPGIYLNGRALQMLRGIEPLPRAPSDHPALERIINVSGR